MPVVLILYNPETKQAYWRHISRDTVESTGKNWKLIVPKKGMFEKPEETLLSLSALAQAEPYLRRLNRLRIVRRSMDLINEGAEVRVEFDVSVNKSLSRYQLTISTDEEEEIWPMLYSPGVGIEEMLENFSLGLSLQLTKTPMRKAPNPTGRMNVMLVAILKVA